MSQQSKKTFPLTRIQVKLYELICIWSCKTSFIKTFPAAELIYHFFTRSGDSNYVSRQHSFSLDEPKNASQCGPEKNAHLCLPCSNINNDNDHKINQCTASWVPHVSSSKLHEYIAVNVESVAFKQLDPTVYEERTLI